MKKIFTLLAIFLITCFAESFAGTYSGGSGTVGDPYRISTPADLIELSVTSGDWSSHFILTQNITFDADETQVDWNGNGSVTWVGEDEYGFSPIGNSSIAFTGTFDGQGFEISNLYINRPSQFDVGFFGRTYEASISNIGIVNCEVTGYYYVGGLVGRNDFGTISNCYSSGSITGISSVGGLVGNNAFSTIINSYSSGSVSGSYNVGGLVGINFDTISNSYSSGSVTGNDYVGGLVGRNSSGSISNSYSYGSVTGQNNSVGGLVGYNYFATISNCYSSGNVSGYMLVGGLVGENYIGLISNSYSSGNVSGYKYIGGLVGYNYSSNPISNCYSSGSVSGTDYSVGGLVGENYGPISNSYASGSVSGNYHVGGLVGFTTGTISNCYSSGSVSGTGYGVGGLVGYNSGTISNSFWDTETSGKSTSAGGTGKSTLEMKNIATFTDENTVGLTIAWDFIGNPNHDTATDDIWYISPILNNGYPFFSWQYSCQNDVYISDQYDGDTPGWAVTHFDDLSDALAITCDGATVNISNYSHTGDVDMTGYTFIIGDGDFVLNGNLTGGLIQTPSTGRLVLPAVQNVQSNYPMGNGSNNFTLKIIPGNEPDNPILVRLVEKSVPGAVKSPMPFWEIEGDDNLNATIVFRIDKSAIAPKTLNTNSLLRYFEGDVYLPFTEEQVTINDKGLYYEIVIINVNKF